VTKIAIVNYGLGNIRSVRRGLEEAGAKVIVTREKRGILEADALVLPGVGAFENAITNLKGISDVLLDQRARYDGTKQGYDLPFLRGLSNQVSVPIIASSDAGTLNGILQSFLVGTVDAALAASIFHYGTYTIQDVKEYLAKHNVPVRLATEQGVTEFIS